MWNVQIIHAVGNDFALCIWSIENESYP